MSTDYSRGTTLIKNVKILTENASLRRVNLLIENGTITNVSPSKLNCSFDQLIDGSACIALPGIIDCHTHMRFPSHSEAEDIMSGTSAAAAGGVTSLIEMPSCQPPASSSEAFRSRIEYVKSKRPVVNIGLYGGASCTNLTELTEIAKLGALGFKTYMVEPDPQGRESHRGMFATDVYSLIRVAEGTRKTGLPLVIHAEDNSIIQGLKKKCSAAIDYEKIRPVFAESIAVTNAVMVARLTSQEVYIAHVSSGEAIRVIRSSRSEGSAIAGELRPDFLSFTKDDLKVYGAYLKTKPPLRTRKDQYAILQAVKDGTIAYLGSDHAPSLKSEKEVGETDFCEAPAGLPSIELSLLVLLDLVTKRKLDLRHLVQLQANAARIFGLPRKGRLSRGADGDIVLVQLAKKTKVSIDTFQTKSRNSALPYDGKIFHGKIVKTLLRGHLVYDEGQVNSEAPNGEYLTRQGRHGFT